MKNSNSLCELQRKIIKELKKESLSNDFIDFIKEKPPISPRERFAIYQSAYRLRMVESLRDDFPRVEEKVGRKEFEKLAWTFILNRPSTYASLSEVSQKFPLFLKSISEELQELASMDWIEILSFHTSRAGLGNILTAEEISEGIPFLLKTNPTLNHFKAKDKVHMAFLCRNKIETQEISFKEFELIEKLRSECSLEDLSAALSEGGFDYDRTQASLIEWIKSEIILCERKV